MTADESMVTLKPLRCRVGDLYWVQEGWSGMYYRATPSPATAHIRRWNAAATMPIERSRFTLQVERIVIQRRYAPPGHLQPEATIQMPHFWIGTRIVDNPWRWFIECGVRRNAPSVASA